MNLYELGCVNWLRDLYKLLILFVSYIIDKIFSYAELKKLAIVELTRLLQKKKKNSNKRLQCINLCVLVSVTTVRGSVVWCRMRLVNQMHDHKQWWHQWEERGRGWFSALRLSEVFLASFAHRLHFFHFLGKLSGKTICHHNEIIYRKEVHLNNKCK